MGGSDGSGTSAPRGSRRVQAVDHAIDILEAIGQAGRPVGVSAIARKTGLSKTSVHHLIATLASRRFVMREEDQPAFRLSWGLYELGASVVRDLDLAQAARPQLDWLSAQTRESTLLGILDDDAVLYLDRGGSPSDVHMVANAGRRSPLHASASGKVLLAFVADPDILDRLTPLTAFTPWTITDIDALRDDIEQVRRRGFATVQQEYEVGLASIAVPVRDYTGRSVGCLAVAGPVNRLTPTVMQSVLRPLSAAAHRIELRLGGARPSRGGPAG